MLPAPGLDCSDSTSHLSTTIHPRSIFVHEPAAAGGGGVDAGFETEQEEDKEDEEGEEEEGDGQVQEEERQVGDGCAVVLYLLRNLKLSYIFFACATYHSDGVIRQQ